MAQHLPDVHVTAAHYQVAWRATGRAGDRGLQVQLMLDVGGALDGYTRNPLMRHTLRLMRRPARAADLGALQAFLEAGFDAFRAMGGAREFLDIVAAREGDLIVRLFGNEPVE